MNAIKFLSLFVLAIGISVLAFAQQPYQKGIGLRLSPANSYYDAASASYKFFVSEAGAIEFNGGFGLKRYGGVPYNYGYSYNKTLRPFAIGLSASYQHHFAIPTKTGGFAWFIGGGFTGYRSFSDNGAYDGIGFGIFPTGGIDYKIPKIPLAVSADYRPTIFIESPSYYDSFYGAGFGISARYTFGKK